MGGVIDAGNNTPHPHPTPPGKSRRRRQQGCSHETFPIHHPVVGRVGTQLGGHSSPPCQDEATEDPP